MISRLRGWRNRKPEGSAFIRGLFVFLFLADRFRRSLWSGHSLRRMAGTLRFNCWILLLHIPFLRWKIRALSLMERLRFDTGILLPVVIWCLSARRPVRP